MSKQNETNIQKDDINIDKEIKQSLYLSSIAESNPIVIKLVEFGYNIIYSRRVFYYLHPNDIEEALNYMDIENGIIQHRFIRNRDISNKLCYICGEHEEFHLKELNINKNNDTFENNKDQKENDNNNINDNNINKNNNINNSRNSLGTKYMGDSENTNNENKELNSNESKENLKNTEYNIKITNNIKKVKEIASLKEKKVECQICGEEFTVTNKNKVKNSGHTFCNGCWYDFLSIKIKENKLPSIKCLDYNCQEKLSDEFIINLLNSDINLIKKYKRYKLELIIINDENKKLCPYPDCDSYLELKNLREKDVTCLNNHIFCFICLKKPHGNLPCNKKIESDLAEFAKNNFVKKCPNCSIIIEKSDGCNHITCSKCGYQWCWLCNQKYEEGHFDRGKCKGFQFFKPKNDYEIKLVMEGKINVNDLSDSQRQLSDDIDDDFDSEMTFERNRIRIPHFAPMNHYTESSFESDVNSSSKDTQKIDNIQNDIRDNIEVQNIEINDKIYNRNNKIGKFFEILIYIFFGHIVFIKMVKLNKSSNGFIMYIISIAYIIFTISFFFLLLIIKIITFILRIVFVGFDNLFTISFTQKLVLILIYLNAGLFCKCYNKWKQFIYFKIYEKRTVNFVNHLLFLSYAFISIIILYPQQIIINIILLIIRLNKYGASMLFSELDKKFLNTFDFELLS